MTQRCPFHLPSPHRQLITRYKDVNKINDHEIESVVVGAEDVQNDVVDRELSECGVENEIRVNANGFNHCYICD